MFLTTNRVQTFDAAFQSRIHISLEYPELDYKSRKAVWLNFLKQHDVAQAASRDRPPAPPPSAAESSSASEKDKQPENEADQKQREEQHFKRTLPHAFEPKDIDKLSHLSMVCTHSCLRD